jgi:putative aldouronate transport system substrate-binding protein
LIWQDRFLSNTLAYGLEGQNYSVVSGDTHDPKDDPVIEAFSGEQQTWAIWHNWVGPLWEQWSSNWNKTAALQEMRNNNLNAPISYLAGFTFDPEPVKQEVAQVTAICDEIEPILNSGSAPNVESFVRDSRARLVAAGAERIIEEIKSQIAAWEASR